MNFFQKIKYELQKQNYLTALLVLNVVVFLVVNLSENILNLPVSNYLMMPLEPSALLHRFWTPLTFMFTHSGLGHLFYNMLLLYFSARMFSTFFSEKKLLYVYVMSGLASAIFMILLSFIFPVFHASWLMGSSASVLGIVCCIAAYSPNLPVSFFGLFEMRYKYFALMTFVLFTVIDFAINTGGKVSHIAGALFGLAYGYSLRRGKDWSAFSFLPNKPVRQKKQLTVVHRRQVSDEDYNSNRVDNQKTLDALLDKISKSGYDSLSKSEKELLFKLSQKK